MDSWTLTEDYSIYENEKVNFFYSDKDHPGVVVGCEFDMGITIMSEDKKEYLLCFDRSSSMWKGKEDQYKAEFLYLIERIKEGYLDDVKYGIWIEENSTVTSGFGPSAEFCPFSLD